MKMLLLPRITFFVATTTTQGITGLLVFPSLHPPRCGCSGVSQRTALSYRWRPSCQRYYEVVRSRKFRPGYSTYPRQCTDTAECMVRRNDMAGHETSLEGPTLETTTSTGSDADFGSPAHHHCHSEQRKRTIYTIDYCAPTDQDKLRGIIQKCIDTLPQYLTNRPIVNHTQIAFTELKRQLFEQNLLDPIDHNLPIKPIVLDSGCGTARSTIRLGKQYPDAIVLGIDRSLLRLTKNTFVTKQYIPPENFRMNKELRQKFESSLQPQIRQEENNEITDNTCDDNRDTQSSSPNSNEDENPDDPTRLIEQVASNVWLIRAELIDFWRFLKLHSWHNQLQAHYMLYPNPYPKQTRLQLRWYAHPSFPLCLQLLQPDENYTASIAAITTTNPDEQVPAIRKMIVRSNWKQYMDEFAVSAAMILDQQQLQQQEKSATTLCRDTKLVVGKVQGMTYPTTKEGMDQHAMTNFEHKYWLVGEPTYELVISNET